MPKSKAKTKKSQRQDIVLLTPTEIESVRAFLRGINKDDRWVDSICYMAHGYLIFKKLARERFEAGMYGGR